MNMIDYDYTRHLIDRGIGWDGGRCYECGAHASRYYVLRDAHSHRAEAIACPDCAERAGWPLPASEPDARQVDAWGARA